MPAFLTPEFVLAPVRHAEYLSDSCPPSSRPSMTCARSSRASVSSIVCVEGVVPLSVGIYVEGIVKSDGFCLPFLFLGVWPLDARNLASNFDAHADITIKETEIFELFFCLL